VLGWLGLLIGIAGLATGYLYYLWTITYPEVTWWSTDQIVFSSQNANPAIRVLDSSGTQIEHNVFAANISVSNTGNALLEHMNEVGSLVRSPLVITLMHSTNAIEHVLSASIVDVSEQSPVNLTCRRSADGVSVTWDHLDPGSGFRVLLLYTASQQLPPDVNISVVGTRRPNHIELTQRMTEIPASEVDPLFRFLFAMVAVTFALFVWFMVVETIHFLGRLDLVNIVVKEVFRVVKEVFRRLNWPFWDELVRRALFYILWLDCRFLRRRSGISDLLPVCVVRHLAR
jgi:hypothetical protein